jgi:uncharacterized protein
MTHANATLLHRLFTGLNQHEPDAMASCYAPDATFEDIAFRRHGRNEIHDMWRMICLGGSEISATFEILHADDRTGRVRLVDAYKFGDDKRPVINVIDSQFAFRDGLIITHRDDCDAHAWGAAAIGGIKGFIAGHVPFVRRFMAKKKLEHFLRTHHAKRRTVPSMPRRT